jgi:hypothetical protein
MLPGRKDGATEQQCQNSSTKDSTIEHRIQCNGMTLNAMQRATVSKQGALHFDTRVDVLFHVPWHHQGSNVAPATWIQLPS